MATTKKPYVSSLQILNSILQHQNFPEFSACPTNSRLVRAHSYVSQILKIKLCVYMCVQLTIE